ncbi:MAG TPA: DUF5916 domain-containing protein [Vicinamibacterales bacterium]|nr:DUF5916 domain-containing protein [Vicinamibacterales bacterium]
MVPSLPRAVASTAIAFILIASVARAGQVVTAGSAGSSGDTSPDLPFAFDGPPVPVAPEVIVRDADGRATVRAIRLSAPLRLDGQLDEAVYSEVPSISDFYQQEPVEGVVATEKTEAWILFDEDAFYVTFRCWESRPDALVANEMRRDSNNIFQNDHIAFLVDTFYDRRNGLEFAVNPIGGRWDGQITNERQPNADWNPIWDVAVGRFDQGWTVELAIPFKSLRYRPGSAQIWGFNARRVNRLKNEISFLTRAPRALGQRALFQASLAATVVGLEAPQGSRNLEIKPYVVSALTSDVMASPPIANDVSNEIGVDVKYGLTQNLTADFTYNTDFAQVEADEQQVNLTRFSLFFPEKREFFLENRGLFGFGGVDTGSGGDTPILFYSRRIGFDRGRQVPIDAGGRVTGRVGRYSLGMLNIGSSEQGPTPATNFSVMRVKRDILRRSSVGLIFTGRNNIEGGTASNQAYGVDGTFAFFANLTINTYWAQTKTDDYPGNDTSYRAQLDYAGDRYGVLLERLVVGDSFRPDVGYVRRGDIRLSQAQFRFSPRPRSNRVVRKFGWSGHMAYTENGVGRVETRDLRGEFAIEFQNSDTFSTSYGDAYEFLPVPANIVGITIPVGGYDYATTRVGYNFGRQRPISGNVLVEHGGFYSGTKTTLSISQGRVNVTPQLSLEPTYLGNWVDVVEGKSTTHLIGSRLTYTVTPEMFVSALVQYNTGIDAVSANVRLRWEYRPGSELFLVLNEQRDTLSPRFPDLVNRSFIVKVNRLVRF